MAGRALHVKSGGRPRLEPLRAIAMDVDSPHRLEALDAIVASAQRNEAAALARRLLRDGDTRVVLPPTSTCVAWRILLFSRSFVGGSFYLEQVVQTDRKAIFVSRSGDPRVVVFGAPVVCRDNLFVESPDERVVIDSREGQDYVSLARRVPGKRGWLVRYAAGRQSARSSGPSPPSRDARAGDAVIQRAWGPPTAM